MITITKEFTKEQLIEQAKKNIEVLRGAVERVPGASDAAVIHLKLAEITLASLEAEPVAWMRDDADGREYNARNEFSGGGGGIPLYATPQVQVVPEAEPVAYQYRQWDAEYDEWGEWEDCGESAFERFVEEEKCLGAGVQTRKLYTAPPAHQPGGFTIEETQELYEDLVRSHISQALSGEKMKKSDRDADLRWIHGVIVQAAWFVKASLEQNALTGNSPGIPDGWISCSERMPAQDDWVLIYSKHGEYLAGQVQGEYVELNDGTLSWLGSALHWMLLPEPPQEVK
ncbi:DUF551 domain-containing protein [Salmonella enterica subsp. enterica serovar Give]|uniref:DUF551 domain-containing protein n=1 Tax=Salmonella enterica TaxID=28901 RepID=UPI00083A5040|nr:DUF551 domain-containing protein [Salmonella enterica]AUM32433.1 hypothetical protein LM70_17850 [Salmonella enterica subsp. enterica serovar Give]OCZ98032.1 hypothetical protein A7W95_01550 [Salmonella enterica subsp. enterica serovar Anatum]